MKKTLVALAALAATSVFAQSSVEMYGLIDMAYQTNAQESRDGSKTSKGTFVGNGPQAGSRLGFRGTEDIGGGTKVIFAVEQRWEPALGNGMDGGPAGNGIETQSSISTAGQMRQGWLGMSGKFGEFKVGRVYTAAYDMYTNNGFIMSEAAGTGNASATIANRIRGVSYELPVSATVKVAAYYGGADQKLISLTGNQATTQGSKAEESKYQGVRAMWAQGPARAGVSYETLSQSCTTNGTAAVTLAGLGIAAVTNNYGANVADAVCTNTGTAKSNATTLVGDYNFGAFKLAGLTNSQENGRLDHATESKKTKINQLTASVPMGAYTLSFNTFTQKVDNVVAGTVANDLKGNALMLNYALSKRTNAYAYTGSQKDTGTAGTVLTDKITRNFVGIRHTF